MPSFDALEPTEVFVPSTTVAQVAASCAPDPPSISSAMATGFDRLGAFVHRRALIPSGPPRAVYTSYGPTGMEFLLAMPVTGAPESDPEEGAERVAVLEGGEALRFTHRGSFANLTETYGLISEYLKDRGLLRTESDWAHFMPMWEEYLTDPDSTPEEEMLTFIYLPLQSA